MSNTIVLEGLRACFVAVAMCAGVKHPGHTPLVYVVANERNGQIPPKTGFACGWDFTQPEPFPVTDWCGGLTDLDHPPGKPTTVFVAATRLHALPHEFLHVLSARTWHTKHQLYDSGYGIIDRGDSAHDGPYWTKCSKLCAGLWP